MPTPTVSCMHTLHWRYSSCELQVLLRFRGAPLLHVACCGCVIEGSGKGSGDGADTSVPRWSCDRHVTAVNVPWKILVSRAAAHKTVSGRTCKSSKRKGCMLGVQSVNAVEWHTLMQMCNTHTHTQASLGNKRSSIPVLRPPLTIHQKEVTGTVINHDNKAHTAIWPWCPHDIMWRILSYWSPSVCPKGLSVAWLVRRRSARPRWRWRGAGPHACGRQGDFKMPTLRQKTQLIFHSSNDPSSSNTLLLIRLR